MLGWPISLTLDGWLAVAGLVGVAVVAVIAVYRPEQLRQQYEKKLEQKIDALTRVHRQQLERIEKKYNTAVERIEELENEYRKMATEYLRIVGENHWLRIQLRAHGIQIPPLPDDLRPKTDAQGNISIIVSPQGGLQVIGGTVESNRDIIGGDSSIGRDQVQNTKKGSEENK